MKFVDLRAAKTHLSRLIDEAAKGEDVVIARNGKPVVRLIPVAAGRRRRIAGSLKGKIWISDDFDAPLPDDLARAFGAR